MGLRAPPATTFDDRPPELAGRLILLFGALFALVTLSLLLTLWAFARPYAPGARRTLAIVGLCAMTFAGAILARRLAGQVAARDSALLEQALRDGETGLLNLQGLERRVTGLAGSSPVYVAAFGVERYAQMRGVLGHERCALMMRRLGTALQALHPDWIVGRMAGDIIAAAFTADRLQDAQDTVTEARRRLQAAQVADPDGAVDARLVIGLSTGDAAAPPTLLREADVALDAARSRRVRRALFDPAARALSAETLSLMAGLRDAIATGDLALAHQPKLDLRTRRVTGVESLVRWTHAEQGPISPDRFIALAEETGDIRRLSEWVLAKAVEDQATLAAAGHTLSVSVNLSGRLVGDDAFTEIAVAAAGRACGRLCLEVTETALIAHPESAAAQFRRFSEAGLAVAIDDYGSGLSSLAYLKAIEADELKLDQTLITALPGGERDWVIIRAAIDLAHNLGMTCTAEGVESEEALEILAAMDCDFAQGWRVGRPLPLDALVARLSDAPPRLQALPAP
jgi:EAL domain-containing protein (putative c-di-GMP-specific phosphodiesterase class I)/GGDEF domain-containing protein